MKIIQGPVVSKTSSETPASPSAAPEVGRLDVLENIAKSILQKFQALDERVSALEEKREAPAIPDEPQSSTKPNPPLSSIAFDSDAVKNGLLVKMWKYLNDNRASKAA